MKLATVIITHNRLEYTQKTIKSYLATVNTPHTLVVVDNASTDGTQEWLKTVKQIDILELSRKNLYPGRACNLGWKLAGEADLYHRSDNDIAYFQGWDAMVLKAFKLYPKLGQLGLVNELYQLPPKEHYRYVADRVKRDNLILYHPLNKYGSVGGPSIVTREVYQKVKWPEDMWLGFINEDVRYSMSIKMLGYELMQLDLGTVKHLGHLDLKKYPKYYERLYRRRKLVSYWNYLKQLESDASI